MLVLIIYSEKTLLPTFSTRVFSVDCFTAKTVDSRLKFYQFSGNSSAIKWNQINKVQYYVCILYLFKMLLMLLLNVKTILDSQKFRAIE